MRVLFSGRMDDPHLGHWATVLKLLSIFDSVLVVILEYPGRAHTASYIRRVFETMAILSKIDLSRLKIITNTTHFAKISMEEWKSYGCDVYAGGNDEVNDHFSNMGLPVYEQSRSFDFSARYYKEKP